MSEKEEFVELEGVVIEALRGKFRVQISSEETTVEAAQVNTHIIMAHIAGKLRKNYIKIVPGDRVKVEVSGYDLTRGRITYRLK